MRTWIKVGIRNLFKNKRRSFFTISAVALGFAAVNVFGGFTLYVFGSLKDSLIYGQGVGHLAIFKKGYRDSQTDEPLKYLLNEEEVRQIREVCEAEPDILLVTPRLDITGLASNGKISTIFIGGGRVRSDAEYMRSHAKGIIGRVKLLEGKDLPDDVPYALAMSKKMAEKLNFDIDSDAILMAPTVDGQMNALDGQVYAMFDSPSEELADKLVDVSLEFAQSLYDTKSVTCLTVLLDQEQKTEKIKARLDALLKERGLDVDIVRWDEMTKSYKQALNMFNVIFVFLFVIVFVIVVLGVINTISMAIMERIREIGTLRALGLKHNGVLTMFATESALLGALGSLSGAVLTTVVWALVSLLQPKWTPPGVAKEVPLEVILSPNYLALTFVFLIVLTTLAAVIPARRAARLPIIDALGHV